MGRVVDDLVSVFSVKIRRGLISLVFINFNEKVFD